MKFLSHLCWLIRFNQSPAAYPKLTYVVVNSVEIPKYTYNLEVNLLYEALKRLG